MSQFGMQMPGGSVQRKASPNVYTGLLAAAALALTAAAVYVYTQGSLLAPPGEGFLAVQKYDEAKKTYDLKMSDAK